MTRALAVAVLVVMSWPLLRHDVRIPRPPRPSPDSVEWMLEEDEA